MFFTRPDGERIPKLGSLRKILPYLMRTRNESVVYFEQELDLTETLAYLREKNEGHAEKQLTFFQIFLCAVTRTLAMRPKLHRFVVGHRTYQRKHIELSFAVKKKFHDDAPFTSVKVRFYANDTLEDTIKRVNEAIGVGRGEKATTSEKEVALVTKLPRFMLRTLVWIQRWLDGMNLIPGAMLKDDPLYASMFLANLGSVGIDSPYHHLFEHGTIPLFGVIGRIKRHPVVNDQDQIEIRDLIHIKWTFDERITDGFYCAQSLQLLKDYIEHPAQLEKPVVPSDLPESSRRLLLPPPP